MAILRENSLKAEESKSGYDGTEQDVDIFLQSDNDPYPGKLPWKEGAQRKQAESEAVEPTPGPAAEEPVDEEQSRLDAIFGDGDYEEEEDPLFGRQNLLETGEEGSPVERHNLLEDEESPEASQRGNLIENVDEEEAKLREIFKEFEEDQDASPDKLNAEKYANDDDESLSAHEKFQLEDREKFDNRYKIDRGDDQNGKAIDKFAAADASESGYGNEISNREEGEFGDSEYANSKIETGEGVRVDISKEDLSELNALRESLKDELSAPLKEETGKISTANQAPFEDVKNDPKAKTIEIPEMERASGEKPPEPFEFVSTVVGAEEPADDKTVDGGFHEQPGEPVPAEDKDQRKKRKFLWIATAVASIMIAISAIGYYYLSDLFTAKPQSEIDSNKKFISAIADRFGAGKEKSKPIKQLKAKEVSKAATASAAATSKNVEPNPENVAANAPAPIVAPRPKPEAAKIIIIEKPKSPKPAIVPKPQTKSAPISKRTATSPKSSFATTVPRRAAVPATGQSELSGGVFTVQVYSTPSREVAEQILNRLIRRNVAGAYISKQNVREVTYYRVRFGKYSSQEQARQAASRAGYPQSWIDRIK